MHIIDKRKIIAVDFDGTLCENVYPKIGKEIVDEETGLTIIEKVKILQKEENMFVILWTCRWGKELEEAIKWCKERGLIFDAINDNAPWMKELFNGESRKIFAHYYLDDRAVNVKDF